MSKKFSPSHKDLFLWFLGVVSLIVVLYVWCEYYGIGGGLSKSFDNWLAQNMRSETRFSFYLVLSFALIAVAASCFSPYFAGEKAKKKRIINEALSAIIHFSPHQILTAAAKINLRFSPEEVEIAQEIMTLANKRRLAEAIFSCLFALDLGYQITRRETGVFDTLAGLLIKYRLDSDVDDLIDLIITANYPLGYALMKAVRQARKEEAVNRLLKVMAEQDQEKEKEMAKKNPTKSKAFNRAFQSLI